MTRKWVRYLLDVMFWSGYISAMIDHDIEEKDHTLKRQSDESLEAFKGKINLLPKKKFSRCMCVDCRGESDL